MQNVESKLRWGNMLGMIRQHKAKILCAAGFFFAGIIFWGGFNTAMEATNTLQFCTTCHEMGDYAFRDYKETIHYRNPFGVRAVCSDCHVPHPWFYKIKRKIEASAEVYHKLAGTISTPEKYEAHRLELAKHVWQVMKETDSRECRNCHSWDAMDLEKQPPRARGMHTTAMKDGSTCIDCHKGIMDKKAADMGKAESAPAPTSFDIQ